MLVVGVDRMDFRRLVANDFAADFFRDVGVGERRCQRVPKRVKAEVMMSPETSLIGALGAAIHASVVHDCNKLLRQSGFTGYRRIHQRGEYGSFGSVTPGPRPPFGSNLWH